ncbi:MAG: type II toxin-antitoxin system VapC family toxin [Raineya sp.]
MKKKKKVLCDTNVISSYLMNSEKAIDLIEKQIGVENIVISSVTYMELQKWLWSYKGLTDKQIQAFKKGISSLALIHIDRKISAVSVGFYENYKEASMHVPDMLIAGTALALRIKVATFNNKDFKFINGLNVYGN